MKALIDTCIVIDFLEKREPFANEAYELFMELAKGSFAGYITSKSVSDVYYLIHRYTHNHEETIKRLMQLLSLLEVVDLSKEDVYNAFSNGMKDYEDALVAESAKRHNLDYIVTRNKKDFSNSKVPSSNIKEFLSLLK